MAIQTINPNQPKRFFSTGSPFAKVSPGTVQRIKAAALAILSSGLLGGAYWLLKNVPTPPPPFEPILPIPFKPQEPSLLPNISFSKLPDALPLPNISDLNPSPKLDLDQSFSWPTYFAIACTIACLAKCFWPNTRPAPLRHPASGSTAVSLVLSTPRESGTIERDSFASCHSLDFVSPHDRPLESSEDPFASHSAAASPSSATRPRSLNFNSELRTVRPFLGSICLLSTASWKPADSYQSAPTLSQKTWQYSAGYFSWALSGTMAGLNTYALASTKPISPQHDSAENPTIRRLQNNTAAGKLTSTDLNVYCEYLKRTCPGFDFLIEGILGCSLPLKNPEKGTVLAIPVGLRQQGLQEPHVVTFLLSFPEDSPPRMEFYDSKGLDIYSSSNRPTYVANQDGFPLTLEEVTSRLISDYGIESIVQNETVHQGDVHNCGVFVLNYLKQRAKALLPETIYTSALDPASIRRDLIFNLTNGTDAPNDSIPPPRQTSPGSVQTFLGSIGSAITARLSNIALHQPHLLHDEKYRVALQSQAKNYPQLFERLRQAPSIRINPSVRSILAILQNILLDSSVNIREQYARYTAELRKAIQTQDLSPIECETIESLCYSKFMNNPMTLYKETFLRRIFEQLKYEPATRFDKDTIADQIERANDALKTPPDELSKTLFALLKQKVEGELDVNADFIGKSNVPEIRSIHTIQTPDGARDIYYLRHGNPNYSGLIAEGEICPEYSCFLKAAEAKHENVFYVNHQRMDKSGHEKVRAERIRDLQRSHPNFFFCSLPLDGPVMKSTEDARGDNRVWFEELIDALLNGQNGFYLPQNVRFEKAELLKLGEEIHQFYFPDKFKSLDRETFLMIFYHYLKDSIKAKANISIMVSACKDNKDRGNASSSIDEALHNLILNKENDPEALQGLFTQCLGLFMIKYEHIIPQRLQPFLKVLRHIASLPDEAKNAIRNHEFIRDYKVIDQRIPREA